MCCRFRAAASLFPVVAAVAFCPHPPVLVPELAQGAAAELGPLRAACRAAIRRVAASAGRLVVLGAGPRPAAHPAGAHGSFAGFGLDLGLRLGAGRTGPVGELPPALTVGAWLVRDALGPAQDVTAHSIGPDGAAPVRDWSDVALLVLGDGSACRSTAAPGYLDPRAAPFDAAVVAAVRSGDPAGLRPAALPDATGLLAAGLPVWQAAAAVVEQAGWAAEVLYDAAPYGVGYLVATWT